MKNSSLIIFALKVVIALFWLFLFIFLIYLIFKSNRGFLLFKEGFWLIFFIFFLGFVSTLLEKWFKNISLIYFLFFYFFCPLIYGVLFIYSRIFHSGIKSLLEISISFGFLLFAFLAAVGFVSYLKKNIKVFAICFLICMLFYYPFYPIVAIVFGWFEQ